MRARATRVRPSLGGEDAVEDAVPGGVQVAEHDPPPRPEQPRHPAHRRDRVGKMVKGVHRDHRVERAVAEAQSRNVPGHEPDPVPDARPGGVQPGESLFGAGDIHCGDGGNLCGQRAEETPLTGADLEHGAGEGEGMREHEADAPGEVVPVFPEAHVPLQQPGVVPLDLEPGRGCGAAADLGAAPRGSAVARRLRRVPRGREDAPEGPDGLGPAARLRAAAGHPLQPVVDLGHDPADGGDGIAAGVGESGRERGCRLDAEAADVGDPLAAPAQVDLRQQGEEDRGQGAAADSPVQRVKRDAEKDPLVPGAGDGDNGERAAEHPPRDKPGDPVLERCARVGLHLARDEIQGDPLKAGGTPPHDRLDLPHPVQPRRAPPRDGAVPHPAVLLNRDDTVVPPRDGGRHGFVADRDRGTDVDAAPREGGDRQPAATGEERVRARHP